MTILEDPVVTAEDTVVEGRLGEVSATVAHAPLEPQHAAGADDVDDIDTPVSPTLAALAAFLSTAAAGWMLGGVFTAGLARAIGVGSAFLGAGMVGVAYKTRRPQAVQFLVLPMALVLGGVLVAPDATGGTANLPSLVAEALRSGGLATPPIPFDPGWRFILVVLISSMAVTSASAAITMSRPRLAVFLPAPVVVAGVLVQPLGAEMVSVGVALVLMVAGLAVAFGADLASQGVTGGAFEARRFGRAGAMLVGLIAVLVVAANMGFLFPEEQENDIIPPKRPETPPSVADRVIFSVKSTLPGPWRVGVLDVYEDNAWLTPPFDPKRFVDVPSDGVVPESLPDVPVEKRAQAEFRIADLEGRLVPNIAGPLLVKDAPGGLQADPRTQQFRIGGRVRSGTTYTVEGLAPPSAVELLAAPSPSEAMRPFLDAPPQPPGVEAMLLEMPAGMDEYDRLQYVRTKLYENVVAAGAGSPVDVPPSRVADMLAGKEASPYEITAAEALLARWVGVPSRVGYGYHGGDVKDGFVEIRPKHGAMWLEAWFEGRGWVSIVGRPPRAKSSVNQSEKNFDPNIRPTEELGAVVYVPIRSQRITLLYTIVQYWVKKILPGAVGVVLLCVFYTGLLKMVRRWRRGLWAGRRGPKAKVAVAYADFRDAAIDFNFGHPTLTPIEFLDVFERDEDHVQLAWLVTRALWGDLARDVRPQDVEQAEVLARTLRRRMRGGQSPMMQLIAVASRASLKDPYDSGIPNFWWPWSPRQKVFAALRVVLRAVVRGARAVVGAPRRLRALRPSTSGAALVLVVVGGLLSGCVQDVDLRARPAEVPPLPAVPTSLLGYTFERNTEGSDAFAHYYDVSLAADGALYAVRDRDGVVQGTLQATVLKPGLSERQREVRNGVLESMPARFALERLGGRPVHAARRPEQRLLLAFSPDGMSYQLLVATTGFTDAEALFANLLAVQQGREAVSFAEVGGTSTLDPRRGP